MWSRLIFGSFNSLLSTMETTIFFISVILSSWSMTQLKDRSISYISRGFLFQLNPVIINFRKNGFFIKMPGLAVPNLNQWFRKPLTSTSPFLPSTMMSSESSLLQTMCGFGWPLASHDRVKLSPSRTTGSAETSLDIIFGGTERK